MSSPLSFKLWHRFLKRAQHRLFGFPGIRAIPNSRLCSSATSGGVHSDHRNIKSKLSSSQHHSKEDEKSRLSCSVQGWLGGPPVTYTSPWEASSSSFADEFGHLEDFYQPLDYATRHLIQLLQELNSFGFVQNGAEEIISLDRCKYLLETLRDHPLGTSSSSSSPPPPSQGTKELSYWNEMQQRAYRANAILQNMQSLRNKNGILQQQMHSNIATKCWPVPDQQVYGLVLEIFQRGALKQQVSMDYVQTVQEIVESMTKIKSLQNHGIRITTTSSCGDFSDDVMIEVSPLHWNSILMCWNSCPDRDRSIRAATQTFVRMPARDASSWVHMMTVCGTHGIPEADKTEAAALGADVAARLWNTHVEPARQQSAKLEAAPAPTEGTSAAESDVAAVVASARPEFVFDRRPRILAPAEELEKLLPLLPSRFYSAFLQAIRHLEAPKYQERVKIQFYDRCMEEAIRQGRVNAVVLHEFLVHARSKTVTEKYLEPYLPAILGLKPNEAAERLTKLVPAQWTARGHL